MRWQLPLDVGIELPIDKRSLVARYLCVHLVEVSVVFAVRRTSLTFDTVPPADFVLSQALFFAVIEYAPTPPLCNTLARVCFLTV